ncbi:hypothetical protein CAP48_09250 [Advenella sp. S44]|uniref:universal stress protein n=1 Tax=Advenella sp. S44 TaxID=1982755 RepID=UPI000C29AC86|nr:universal stress protein [Advenella sp. S44]PJX26179.1 hypothetical protein CAP48_09250 [Advenella sp. S44]
MKKIIACVNGAAHTLAVCDSAVWASRHLNIPIDFLHVLDTHQERVSIVDLSGAIGFDAHDVLLDQLSELDEQRSKLAQLHGKHILDAGRARAAASGVTAIETRQRHGALAESLQDLQDEARLIILGQHSQGKRGHHRYFDHKVEKVVRSVDVPVLVVSESFRKPESFLIAFDGSTTARNMVQRLTDSPLLAGLKCHVLYVAEETQQAEQHLNWLRTTLAAMQFAPVVARSPGEPETIIVDYISSNNIDLLAMGAYGHSRIREFIVGSLTTTLLRTSPVPVLIMR